MSAQNPRREGGMRYREVFTVFPRRMKSGRKIYYYQTYNEEGRRTSAKSTGMVRARDARVYCMKLYRAGLLGVTEKRTPTMAEFAHGWWDPKTCDYLKSRMTRRKISTSYVRIARAVLEKDILPAFAKRPLNKITTSEVDKWVVLNVQRGRAGRTVNRMLMILKIMLGQAVKKRFIDSNPCDGVQRAVVTKNRVEILTGVEVRQLFEPSAARELWRDEMHYTLNMLAATTGLRIGEIQGLRGSCLQGEYYLEVSAQYNAFHEYTDTKTHETRYVTIPTIVASGLSRLREANGEGYLFSNDGGRTPISRSAIYRHFQSALGAIGIDRLGQRHRNLTFHKWRHFFNTTLRMGNVADSKVRKLTGHKSEAMTELYTDFDPREFTDVRRIQEKIVTSDANGEAAECPERDLTPA